MGLFLPFFATRQGGLFCVQNLEAFKAIHSSVQCSRMRGLIHLKLPLVLIQRMLSMSKYLYVPMGLNPRASRARCWTIPRIFGGHKASYLPSDPELPGPESII